MSCRSTLGTLCIVLLAVSTANEAAAQAEAATDRAAAAAKASPELGKALFTELGSTPEQSAGAAGALFSVAKSRLKAEEFAQGSKAVPGMRSLLKAAPATAGGGAGGALGAMSKAVGTTGSASSLASAASAFSSLGL